MTHHPAQLPSTLPDVLTDALIDRALHSLRDTAAPSGLQARVTAHLAQAAEARGIPASPFANRASLFAAISSRAPLFAVILSFAKDPRILLAEAPLYTLAATALLVLSLFALHLHHKPQTVAHSNLLPAVITSQTASELRAGGPSHTSGGRDRGPQRAHLLRGLSPTYAQTTAKEPEARSIVPFYTIKESTSATVANDPETLALAETLAPSRPAPPMPLTPQEQLLIAATRQGQPIELAELDLLRAPALRSAAEARERSNLRQFAQGLLGPLAAAEALDPPPPDPPSAP
jgi:hypothetical protein